MAIKEKILFTRPELTTSEKERMQAIHFARTYLAQAKRQLNLYAIQVQRDQTDHKNPKDEQYYVCKAERALCWDNMERIERIIFNIKDL